MDIDEIRRIFKILIKIKNFRDICLLVATSYNMLFWRIKVFLNGMEINVI